MNIAAAGAKVPREVEFLRRYEQLLKWAQKLTDADRGLAQDVVHDAFVQFMLSGAALESIENLDHYLHEVVRNAHRTQIRRRSSGRLEQLSEIDADAAPAQLPDPHGALQARKTLLAICRYVSRRKEASIASSILVLRFLHGYYPNEVAQLTCRTRSAVDVSLKVARRDLKEYLGELPLGSFREIEERPHSSVHKNDMAGDLSGLRRILFEAKKGECFNREQLGEIYADVNAKLSRSELSHLVSCASCLDHANAVLGLVSLRNRSPIDVLGKIPTAVWVLFFSVRLAALAILYSFWQEPDAVSDLLCGVADCSAIWQQQADLMSDYLVYLVDWTTFMQIKLGILVDFLT
jgi:RNA polymerase sigma factor (sigma-70 family)